MYREAIAALRSNHTAIVRIEVCRGEIRGMARKNAETGEGVNDLIADRLASVQSVWQNFPDLRIESMELQPTGELTAHVVKAPINWKYRTEGQFVFFYPPYRVDGIVWFGDMLDLLNTIAE